MEENTISQLQQQLYSTLKRAARHRRILSIARIFCYGGALVWFVGVFWMQFHAYSGGDMSFFYTLDSNTTFFEQYKMVFIILPLFLLITIGSVGLSIFYRKFTEAEQSSIRHIIRTMFPDARLSLVPSEVSLFTLSRSHFFGGMNTRAASGYSFGSVAFEHGGRRMIFRDLLVNSGGMQNHWLARTSIGGLFVVLLITLKGIFSKRVENMGGNFRGMFTDVQLEKKIDGTVVVLPDRLEKHVDYLAKNIQALKNVQGNRLVTLEDPEFERYFAVYTSNEITARYVLTPAMMLRMTELRKKYNREIMLSFENDHFYFAVAIPEGFLTLGANPLASGSALSDLYDNFATAQGILNDLRIS